MAEAPVDMRPEQGVAFAPGQVVVVRDEEWMVESVDADGDT